jgi:hypothetical protein
LWVGYALVQLLRRFTDQVRSTLAHIWVSLRYQRALRLASLRFSFVFLSALAVV